MFDAATARLGALPLIAEDLGVITPAVERLRDDLGLPGMVVLQFGFDPDEPAQPPPPRQPRRAPDRLHRHARPRHGARLVRVASPETRAEVDAAVAEAGVGEREPWWSLIRLAFASPARVAMVQAQDVLGLGSEARMNKPGTARGAWRWRLEDGALTPALAARLREATVAADRAPGSPSQVRA